MPPDVPAHWQRGALLDLKRFSDGSYRATLLGETYDPSEPIPCMEFDSSFAAQQFVSHWYMPERGRMQ